MDENLTPDSLHDGHALPAEPQMAPRRDPRKIEFEANKLRKRLRRQVGEAIGDYGLIAPHDRVMVCVSGGKDSYGLLDILLTLKDRAPFPFEIVAVNLDQKQPGFPADVLPRYLERRGVAFRIVEQDTYSVVKRLIPEGGTLCSLCSRLRRGVLYRVASEIGATRIALGHHRDDLLATFFLNLFFGGKLKTMPPKLVSDDGRHVVIRPLAYVRERDLARFAELNAYPIIPCNLCGSQEHLQRKQVTAMLREWERKHPGRIESIFNALGNVAPSHLLDRALFDFPGVRATGRREPDGDVGFDVDPVLEQAAGSRAAAPAAKALPASLLRAAADDD
jgi:tRNA 2-thiocytidine biosynthesis protein TtcA